MTLSPAGCGVLVEVARKVAADGAEDVDEEVAADAEPDEDRERWGEPAAVRAWGGSARESAWLGDKAETHAIQTST